MCVHARVHGRGGQRSTSGAVPWELTTLFLMHVFSVGPRAYQFLARLVGQCGPESLLSASLAIITSACARSFLCGC